MLGCRLYGAGGLTTSVSRRRAALRPPFDDWLSFNHPKLLEFKNSPLSLREHFAARRSWTYNGRVFPGRHEIRSEIDWNWKLDIPTLPTNQSQTHTYFVCFPFGLLISKMINGRLTFSKTHGKLGNLLGRSLSMFDHFRMGGLRSEWSMTFSDLVSS